MNSIERVRQAFAHQEPDRVPIDLGGILITEIHKDAYKKLLLFFGMETNEPAAISRYRHQTALIEERILEKFSIDFRQLQPPWPALVWDENEQYSMYTDEFGAKWRMNKSDGLYYDLFSTPFNFDTTHEEIEKADWPDYSIKNRIAGLEEKAETILKKRLVPVLELPLGLEIFDGAFNLFGYEDFYMLLAADEKKACHVMDKLLECQMDWWGNAVETLPEGVFIIRTGDDLGDQYSTRISEDMYRRLVKPRHKKLFRHIKDISRERIKIVMHSDGAILPLIPDLIEMGVDCLNPIQYSIEAMNPVALKREFGRDLVFWGGGVDTQSFLPGASVQQVKDEVKRMIEILGKDGGYIFSQVHIIQNDVPPENIAAMLEAALAYC